MDNFYFILIIILGVGIPFLLHKWLKKRIRSINLLVFVEIFIGLTILVIGLILPFCLLFSSINYPTISKKIDNNYYFEQTEYGMAWTNPGKHLDFYKKRKFWFDKKVGHIQWLWGTRDLQAQIEMNALPNMNRLILTDSSKIVLDTVVNIENGFDFIYLPRD